MTTQETKVNVKFCIGSRRYFQEVTKKGAFYFDKGRKMTKGRGYWDIQEIPSITPKMKEDMYSDSMYY